MLQRNNLVLMLFVSVSIKKIIILGDTEKHIHIMYLTLWDDTFSNKELQAEVKTKGIKTEQLEEN